VQAADRAASVSEGHVALHPFTSQTACHHFVATKRAGKKAAVILPPFQFNQERPRQFGLDEMHVCGLEPIVVSGCALLPSRPL
jgi:hypothetical protein